MALVPSHTHMDTSYVFVNISFFCSLEFEKNKYMHSFYWVSGPRMGITYLLFYYFYFKVSFGYYK